MGSEKIPVYCYVCQAPIPDKRIAAHKVTCSDLHTLKLKNARREREPKREKLRGDPRQMTFENEITIQ